MGTGFGEHTCRLETLLRTLAGRYLLGDHLEGVGDTQKLDDDDSELVDDALDEVPVDGSENLAMEDDGVASSLGDFS